VLRHALHWHIHRPVEAAGRQCDRADGKSFDVLYSTAAKWRDGRIIEEYLFWDNGTFLSQVGLA
jgi:hypothetical protein